MFGIDSENAVLQSEIEEKTKIIHGAIKDIGQIKVKFNFIFEEMKNLASVVDKLRGGLEEKIYTMEDYGRRFYAKTDENGE